MIYLFTSYGFSRQHVHAAAEKAKDGDDEEALGAVVEAEEQAKAEKASVGRNEENEEKKIENATVVVTGVRLCFVCVRILFDNIITYLLTLLTFVHMILPILSERLGFSKCRWCGRRECCGQGEGRCGCNCEHGVQDIWWSGTKVEVKWS